MEGLAALLRRNIPVSQLLPVCWKEWTVPLRSEPTGGSGAAAEKQQWTGGDPAAGYRAICRDSDGEKMTEKTRTDFTRF